jgi:hypothetical protein
MLILAVCAGRTGDAAAAQRIDAGVDVETDGEPPAVAVNASGRAVALVGYRRGRVWGLALRVAHAGHRFGHARLVPASRVRPGRVAPARPRVVVGVDGTTLLMWTMNDESGPRPPDDTFERCCRRLWAAVVDPAGHIGPASQLSAANSGLYEFVGSVRGRRAVVAWHDQVGARVAVADARGRFSSPATLAADPRVGLIPADFVPLAVHLADGQPRVVMFEPSGAVVELQPTPQGPVRRQLGALPRWVSILAVSSTADGHLLVVAEALGASAYGGQMWIGHRRPGRPLRFTQMTLAGTNLTDPAAAIVGDGRGLVVAEGASAVCPLAVLPVQSDGTVGSPHCLPLAVDWKPWGLAAAASSSGQALVGAVAATPGLAQMHVFAWRIGLNGGDPRRRAVRATTPSLRPSAGIDTAGTALLAWDVFAARVR